MRSVLGRERRVERSTSGDGQLLLLRLPLVAQPVKVVVVVIVVAAALLALLLLGILALLLRVLALALHAAEEGRHLVGCPVALFTRGGAAGKEIRGQRTEATTAGR
jgi:hypothetical protein